MDADAASEGDNQKRDASDNNNENNVGSNSKIGNSSEGQSKPKRQMKTPFQLETLEKAYAMETYPSEAMRVELSEKLGLTDRQLQMWFCHRRLKEKKEMPGKKLKKTVPALPPDSPPDELRVGAEMGSDYGSGSGSGSGSSPIDRSELRNVVPRDVAGYYESPQSVMELRAIACVEAQLGEPLREDGPILGIEFDQLPPDAFGAPIAVTEQPKRLGYDGKIYERHDVKSNKSTARRLHEYPFLLNQSGFRTDNYGKLAISHLRDSANDGATARTQPFVNEQPSRVHAVHSHASRVRLLSQQDKQGMAYPSPPCDDESAPKRDSFTNTTNIGMNAHLSDHLIVGLDNSYALSSGQIAHNNEMLRMERKRKSDDSRIGRDSETHEIRIRKELEKQDNLRRKSEERMKKEMEKQDRERRKEEERLMREKQKEEERIKREQRREMERREKNLQKENLRAEKMRQKEELRKEKDAVRRKAAIEKATARRIAKESMELIEDEQLELMELAAANKGLSSIIHLDLDALQNLESVRGSLIAFPPKSVKLKKPFAIQPWMSSEENIGNLLMVWRFLITFADVLELWPFTLDEFVQAFHDYESRLLGEIHVALLKVIVKDIEDVARTPSTGLGMNQNGGANPAGGHPEIVEGAYAWGFDICNWQQHLNPLTWPEIFRQLALAAGLGPQLKKRSITWSCSQDKEDGGGCQDIISTLRNGSAAETAVAIMQEKGLLAPRKSRHRLTPGTVKFAAFHVLSLEGSKGLTVLELAEKIQKSGLRDLTTSKTPEASISVALTRDAKLFERIAPSTYRLRAAYRKDPSDAEAILSEARKKIQIFENGFLAGEDADDVERDEESESDDVDEDPEVDNLVTPTTNKTTEHYDDVNTLSANGKENLFHDVEVNLQNQFDKDISSFPESGSKNADCPSAATGQPVANKDITAGNIDQDDLQIDESKSGESWIQGITEGEYSDLSVDERLNALAALVGIANEGNSIRVVLEGRLEAANALKKQMWAEAQLDKSRVKDDYINKLDFPSFIGNKGETKYTFPPVEGNQSPLPDTNRNVEASPSTVENHKQVSDVRSIQNHLTSVPDEKPPVVQDFYPGADNFLIQQVGYTSKRSRSQLKAFIAHRAEEMYVYRSLPLGQDRRHNRYWNFVACSSSNDPGSGRIFVELHDGNWRLIDCEEAFDALMMSLDTRGIRESHLRIMLQKIESSFKENVRKNSKCIKEEQVPLKSEANETDSSPDSQAGVDSPSSTLCGVNSDSLETSSSFRIEFGRNDTEKKAALRRYQDFQKWMWKECYNSSTLCAMKYGKKRCSQLVDVCDICLNSYFFEDLHCLSCHQNFSSSSNGFNSSKHAFQCGEKKLASTDIYISDSFPLRTRLLKILLSSVEVSVRHEALQSIWMEDNRKQWGVKLSTTSSLEELLQILTQFEKALQRDFLSSNFSTTEELLGLSTMTGNAVRTSKDVESIPLLPWIPQTTAAVSLRLLEFDASISYKELEKPEPCEDKEVIKYIKLPLKSAPPKTELEAEPAELAHDAYMREDNSADVRSVRKSNKRGHQELGRCKRLSKRMYDSKRDSGCHNIRSTENSSQGLRQHGRGTHGQVGGRGRRTVRKRRVEKRAVEDLLLGPTAATHRPKVGGESVRNLGEKWGAEKVSGVPLEDYDNSNSAEEVESDEDAHAMEYENGNWEAGFNGAPSRWSRELMEMSDEYEEDAFEDDNGLNEQADEDLGEDVMSLGSDGIVNEDGTASAVSDDSCD